MITNNWGIILAGQNLFINKESVILFGAFFPVFAEGLVLHINTVNSHVWAEGATFTFEGTFLVISASELGGGRKFFRNSFVKLTADATKRLIDITKDRFGHTEHFNGEHDW